MQVDPQDEGSLAETESAKGEKDQDKEEEEAVLVVEEESEEEQLTEDEVLRDTAEMHPCRRLPASPGSRADPIKTEKPATTATPEPSGADLTPAPQEQTTPFPPGAVYCFGDETGMDKFQKVLEQGMTQEEMDFVRRVWESLPERTRASINKSLQPPVEEVEAPGEKTDPKKTEKTEPEPADGEKTDPQKTEKTEPKPADGEKRSLKRSRKTKKTKPGAHEKTGPDSPEKGLPQRESPLVSLHYRVDWEPDFWACVKNLDKSQIIVEADGWLLDFAEDGGLAVKPHKSQFPINIWQLKDWRRLRKAYFARFKADKSQASQEPGCAVESEEQATSPCESEGEEQEVAGEGGSTSKGTFQDCAAVPSFEFDGLRRTQSRLPHCQTSWQCHRRRRTNSFRACSGPFILVLQSSCPDVGPAGAAG